MAKYRISIDKDLQDIVPAYLEARSKEIPELLALHSAADLEALRRAGHKLSGSGGGYGFDRISDLGRQIETLAQSGDAPAIAERLAELKDYVENLEVVYE